MSGNTNFPTALDDNTSLFDVTDSVSSLVAAHHNNLKEAIKALEAKVGIYNTAAPTALDFRIGNPTTGHNHNGASGQGGPISPSTLAGFQAPRHILNWGYQGSVPSLPSLGAPMKLPLTLQLESVSVQMKRAPSGATAAFDINFGATSVFEASQLLRPIFPAGTSLFYSASPNLITYASGTLIVVDADKVGTNEPSSDLSIIFVFRE